MVGASVVSKAGPALVGGHRRFLVPRDVAGPTAGWGFRLENGTRPRRPGYRLASWIGHCGTVALDAHPSQR